MPKVSDAPQRILRYISEYDGQHGFSPTIREICAGIGICSASTVHRHVNKLKEQGILIETKPGSPRSLAINIAVKKAPNGRESFISGRFRAKEKTLTSYQYQRP